jgi:hypothetical protein
MGRTSARALIYRISRFKYGGRLLDIGGRLDGVSRRVRNWEIFQGELTGVTASGWEDMYDAIVRLDPPATEAELTEFLRRAESALRPGGLVYFRSGEGMTEAAVAREKELIEAAGLRPEKASRFFWIGGSDRICRKLRTIENVDPPSAPSRPSGPRSVKVTAVLPAYNAARTLKKTVADIPRSHVDEILLVDDVSRDDTVKIARELGLTVVCHQRNRGYGGNQKTCYRTALDSGAGIMVMVHPDYQYDPRIIPQLIEPILQGRADAVFGSRMMKGGALEGGMPLWKHNANILLTAFENVMLGTYLTEYHSGFRAYSAKLLNTVRFEENSDNFIFDTEIIVQTLVNGFRIEEVPIQTRYFDEASSIRLGPSIRYGLGIVMTMLKHFLHVRGIWRFKSFDPR